jgi:3-hydroxyacyl-CoA dehydrogenase
MQKMMDNKLLSSKTKQGFFKKVVEDDKKKFLSINFDTLEYEEAPRPKFGVFEKTKAIDSVKERMPILFKDKGKVGDFYRSSFYSLFQFSSNRIPEISDDIYKVDDALNAGFGWKLGPFQTWDAVGVEDTVKAMEEAGKKPAQWVYDMLDAGIKSFYKLENGFKYYYDIPSKSYMVIPGQEDRISLEVLKQSNVLWENNDLTIIDLGDGVINAEIHTKMNTIGAGVLEGLNKAVDMAEADYKALVISNEGDHFSAGANVGMIYMLAIEQEWEELDLAVQWFQKTTMRMRYSSIPVIAAPHGMALGGGCELCMHSDKVVAHAETYMGLVEFGVGIIPGGAGSKEMALRASEGVLKDDVKLNKLRDYFINVAMAKVATSAHEGYDLGFLKEYKDIVVVNKDRQVATAKRHAIQMLEDGYTQPVPKNVLVYGQQALGMFLVGTDSLEKGHYASEHDKKIANKLGYVMAGGDLSEPTYVSEKYLLDLEREAFMSLCTERKTLERIEHMLKTGKPLRN